MDSKTSYSELQRFDQKWVKWVLAGCLLLTFATSVTAFFTQGRNVLVLLPFLLVVIIFLLFQKLSLQVNIDAEKISYRFTPLQSKEFIIRRSEINQITVGSYNPIREFGGWGIRIGRSGKAVSTSGNFGIRINYGKEKQLLIGTKKPADVLTFLQKNNYHPAQGSATN